MSSIMCSIYTSIYIHHERPASLKHEQLLLSDGLLKGRQKWPAYHELLARARASTPGITSRSARDVPPGAVKTDLQKQGLVTSSLGQFLDLQDACQAGAEVRRPTSCEPLWKEKDIERQEARRAGERHSPHGHEGQAQDASRANTSLFRHVSEALRL